MEKYLLKADQSIEMKEQLEAAKTECDLEYEGSSIFKDIQVLVSDA